ncbi:hypothetical protein SAMN04488499_103811 [Sporomusa acidovorans]|nr:hypothetical protein SAMN04488499_103811 [Sporomusa acidovorans]
MTAANIREIIVLYIYNLKYVAGGRLASGAEYWQRKAVLLCR